MYKIVLPLKDIFQMRINRHILYLCLVLLKISIILFSDNNQAHKSPFTITESIYDSFVVNPDELDIASIALNCNNGLGFVVKSDYYSRNKLRPTAWRTSYPVFMHILTQQVYQYFYPDDDILIDYHHRYFQYYGLFIQILSVVMFWLSLYYFYQLALQFLQNKKLAAVAVVLYTLLPSVLYYVGTMVCYENIALGCVVITTAVYHQMAMVPNKISWKNITLVTLFSVSASLLRPHTILIFLFLMGTCIIILFIRYYKFRQQIYFRQVAKLVAVNFIMMIFVQVPALYKNYRTFGKYTLSTQADYNFLLSHNEYARGSWLGDSGFNTEWDQYIARQIPGIENMNEFEEAQARKKLAVQWIKDNPEKELWLIARKTAMFFLPDNYLHHQEYSSMASVVNTLLFIGFIISCIQLITKLIFHSWQESWLTDSVIYLPVIASLLFSILFFVDHRWRYYAEPFILLIAFRFILSLLANFNIHLLPANTPQTDIENENSLHTI